MKQLENHELDVIVQVRKLGEGLTTRFLLLLLFLAYLVTSPLFVQFVGRIMRVIKQNAPGNIVNRGVVVFHVGANVARRWASSQYSGADQDYLMNFCH